MDKAALSRATDSSTAPTPGYLYNDIGKSLTSPQTCVETLNYLISRLSKNNPHIKKKCLKVLAKISVHPASRGMMKRAVVQNPNAIAAIKEAMAYRGNVDAVTGDQYNIEVREAAKECLEVVYSDAGDQTTASSSGAFAGNSGQLQGGGMAGLGANSSPSKGYGSQGQGGGGGYGAPMGGQAGAGYGGVGINTVQPGPPQSSGQMQGIGNPMFSDPRLAQQNASKMGQLGGMASSVGGAMLDMIKDPLAKTATPGTGLPGGGAGGGYNPNARPDPYAQPPPGRNNLAMHTGGQWTMASNRGPNAVGNTANSVPEPPSNHQNSEYYKARNAQPSQAFSWAANPAPAAAIAPSPVAPTGVGGTWGSASVPTPPSQQPSVATQARQPAVHQNNNVASAMAITGTPASISAGVSLGGNGDYEKNLILELCPPGGMKAEPPQDKLVEFANAIPSLNPDLICPALLDALEDGNPWIMRAKALCVIETVLKVEVARGGDGGQAYTDFFYECSGEIQPLAKHARASVKGPAKRVLMILGVDGTTSMNGSSNGAVSGAAPVEAPPTNLLDFDEPTAPPVTTEQPAITQPAAPSIPSAGGDSLFGGMNIKAASAPAQHPPPPTPPAQVAQQQQQDDLLGGLGTPVADAPPAPVSSGSNDMFGGMNMKSTETTAAVETAPSNDSAVANGGSAFGFMSATPSSPKPPPPPTAQVPPASPPKQAFDPLLNMGTNNNMTNSPNGGQVAYATNANGKMQQMQIAYQQQMMMMQQQMQQMQMSAQQQGNFQRQGSGGGMPPNMMQRQGSGGQPVMGANYHRQVPGVQGDKMTSFSFLAEDPKRQASQKSFDFIKDTMKKG